MYTVKYYRNDKLIGQRNYKSLEEAENNYDNDDFYNKGDYYEIIDVQSGNIVQEFEIPDNDDILDSMFDDEDSREGFDWTVED